MAQDDTTGQLRMHAYMNAFSLRKTLETGYVHYFSRSRNALWKKGETSGHFQHVKSLHFNCTMNAVLVRIDQEGVACHTGCPSCFFNSFDGGIEEFGSVGEWTKYGVLRRILDVALSRKEALESGERNGQSYIHSLLSSGKENILKKLAERTADVVSAAPDRGAQEVETKVTDLLFDLLVFLASEGVSLESVLSDLESRLEKTEIHAGNRSGD